MKLKLTLPRKNITKESKDELIDLSCKTHLSQINSNNHDIKYLINQLDRNQLQYSIELGIICAHVAYHQNPIKKKTQGSDLQAMHTIVIKFYLVFNHRQSNPFSSSFKECNFKSMDELVFYGSHCVKMTMAADFLESIENKKQFYQRVNAIIARLLRSLLLEFIPLEYSRVVLNMYLQESDSEQQQIWMHTNRIIYQDLYPYQDIFQIVASLSHHILHIKKAVSWNHFLEILDNPVMGVVEWPMVIGVRSVYNLPKFRY